MKKNHFLVFMILLTCLLFAVPGYSWQGRIAGAGDASGLIEDESDYLTHPALIAEGKGFNAYGFYRLTYDKVGNWDYSMRSTSGSVGLCDYTADGEAWKNEVQVGTAFTVGTGRIGIFLEYISARGKYDGSERYSVSGGGYSPFDMEDNLDNLALKLLYGFPVGGLKLGGEIQVAYRNEGKEENMISRYGFVKNFPFAARVEPTISLYPYMIPFDSKYWEAQGKVSVEGLISAVKYAFTLKGGFPFASDNKYTYFDSFSVGEMNGKVKGFNVGGDFWLRVPISGSVVLPFIVSAEYETITRDGSGIYFGVLPMSYEHETKNLFIKIGGGVDFTPAQGTKLAAGLYYDYLSAEQYTYNVDNWVAPQAIDTYSDMPTYDEHRLTFKVLMEKELTTVFVLRGGFNIFYGLVESDYAYRSDAIGFGVMSVVNVPTSGSNMGVNAGIGATVRLNQVSLEPFINGGYAKYSISGDGAYDASPAQMEMDKTNWHIGGGLSVKF